MSESSKLSKLSKLSLIGLLVFVFFIAQAQTTGNATLSLVKDKSSDLFVLTFGDPEGIQSFALEFSTDKPPYSGDLGGCPKSRKIDNIGAVNDSDLAKTVKGRIVDCRGGETEFEISSTDASGRAQVKKLSKEPPPPATAPTPSVVAPTPAPTSVEPKKELKYPIAELGNCSSEESCKKYCDGPANMERCVAFAEEHNLIPREEIERGKKFIEVVKSGGGPGGCKTEATCESYCNDIGKIDECVKFAEDHGFLSERELSEAKKVKAALDAGKKFPGDCRNKKACEAYCQSPEHIDECFAFAKESGFMSEQELQEAEKFIPLMKQGKTPGGCKTKEACEAFCEDENNFDTCVAFAEEAGLLSDQEKEIIKKTGGKGPGGCRGRACQTFCQNPANQEVCLAFAKDNGLISEEDLKRAEEGMKFMRESLENADPGVKECVEKIIGAPGISGQEPGKNLSFGGPEIGEKMRECIESMLPEEMRGQFKFEGSGFEGPGGCKSREECEAYCTSNPEACGFGGGDFPTDPGTSFLECVSKGMSASYVCGINGKGAPSGVETTYFNECHAKQQGTEILHEGVCIRNGQPDKPCSDIADPVCGNDNNAWVSACHAEDQGGGVQYEGVCKGPGGGGGGGNPVVPPFPQPPPPTQSCVPPPSGLVSWVDDDVLSNAVSGVTLAPGKVGNAFKFDASGEYVKDENSEKLNFGTGPFSLEAWINWDGGGSSKGNIIRKSNYPMSGDGAGYWLVIGKDKSIIEFFAGETVGNADKPRGSVSAPISSGAWHHVAATRIGSGTMSLYIDGQLNGTAEAANANTTSPAPFTLGAWDDRFGITELFSGLIDEVSVYNRALSAPEVQAIFNAGSNGKCSASSGGGGGSGGGPGGCQSTAECTTYCTTHYTDPACAAYAVPEPYVGDGSTPTPPPATNFSGPGGCTTPEECKTYCTKNYQDPACKQFMPSSFLQNKSPFALLLWPILELLK